MRCIELKRIFVKFDADGSNTLELEEFFQMFRENYLDSLFVNIDDEYKTWVEKEHSQRFVEKVWGSL